MLTATEPGNWTGTIPGNAGRHFGRTELQRGENLANGGMENDDHPCRHANPVGIANNAKRCAGRLHSASVRASNHTIGSPYRIDPSCLSVQLQRVCRLGHSVYRRPRLLKFSHSASFPHGEQGKLGNLERNESSAANSVGRAVRVNSAAAYASGLEVRPFASRVSCLTSPSRANPA